MATIEIRGIAAGGAGVGRLADGRAVFVHRTAPGERVRVRVTENRRAWARAELLEVLDAAPERRVAPCPYYDRCGGCTLEHLDYAAQLRAKAAIVADALRRIGGVEAAEPDVVPSPLEFRYRNRVGFTLTRLGAGRVVAGFHERERPGRVLDMDGRCLLPEEPIAEAWDALRAAWGRDAFRLPSGRRLRLTLRGTHAGDVALRIDGGFGPGRAEELLARVPRLRAVWHRPSSAEDPSLLAGAGSLEERWGGADLRLGGDVFVQVNRRAAAALEEHVVGVAAHAAAGRGGGARIVDAYCGVGLLSRRLAASGARVVGIEVNGAAVAEARRGAPPGAEFVRGRVEDVLPNVLPADVLVLNPPRAGLARVVSESILASAPPVVVYVSCDPATLARDLGRLAGRFRVARIRCFDLFPQTAHVETVVELACDTS